MRHIRWIVPAAVLASFAGWAARAAEISGTARVYGGTTDTVAGEQEQLFQDYDLRLVQRITPWLQVLVAYHDNRLDVQDADDLDLERQSREPLIQLSYRRKRFDLSLGASERRVRGSNPADDLDVRSAFATLSWKPRRGPRYSLRLREDSNVADVAVFGRDIDSRALDFDLLHSARSWNLRYAFNRFDVDNRLTGFALDQERHLLRLNFDRRLWDDRISLSTGWRITHTDQTERAPAGAGLAEPLPARLGLYALDLTPELGELESVPTLVDGDTVTPAVPRIEIGGANTFRNVGVDLGLARQVTRLEITVDAVSDPGVLWEVYRSPDNLTWERVPGAATSFDVAFLRYTVRFPETTDQYFKAVNVSVNSQPDVAVTEVRALVDVPRLSARDRRSTGRRADVAVGIVPSERVQASLSLNLNEDSGSEGGLPARDSREAGYESRVRVELAKGLNARVHYAALDLERDQAPLLRRDERRFGASLQWSPRETVDAVMSATRRIEWESAVRIRSSDTVRLQALTRIYEELRLNSELAYSRRDDPLSGFTLGSWTWRETMDGRPLERWSLGGGIALSWFDSTGTLALDRRSSAFVRTSLSITPFLSLSGDASWGEEDDRTTVSQHYLLSWAPGPKLAMSVSHGDSDSAGLTETRSTSANLSYQMNRKLNLFASFSRSVLERVATDPSRVTSLTAGMTLAF